MAQPDFRLKNCMEDLIWQCMDKVLTCYDGLCTCERCKHDIFALVLNSLPSRYVVTDLGETYTKVRILDDQFRARVMTEISIAAEIVKNNPRHDAEPS